MDLRTDIINYLDDKSSDTLIKQEPSIARTNMMQTLSTGDQGEQGEDEEMKNEDLSPAVPERQMQICAQRKGDTGIATKTITTAQTVRMTNKTTAAQLTGHGRNKKTV